MQTVLEIIQKSTDWLRTKGVEKPRLDAEWMLARVLGCPRLNLYLRFDDVVVEPQLSRMREMVRRRGRREPLAYILGQTDFYGLSLRCDARALIPRPETEELVELLVQRMVPPPASVLDLGTGTGAIALALAKTWPDAAVTALDFSPEALALARENAAALDLADRITFLTGDWFMGLAGRFALIVANPPYLSCAEVQTAEPEVREYEPIDALGAGSEGLDDLATIIQGAREHLFPGGWLALETGIAQHDSLREMARQAGLDQVESLCDLQRRWRFFLACNRPSQEN